MQQNELPNKFDPLDPPILDPNKKWVLLIDGKPFQDLLTGEVVIENEKITQTIMDRLIVQGLLEFGKIVSFVMKPADCCLTELSKC